jgi:uncharacterized membrane protein
MKNKDLHFYVGEILSILLLLINIVFIVTTILYYNHTLIPLHYNIMGEVDSWSSNPIFLFLLPTLSILCYIGLTFLQTKPHIFNFPQKVTEENRDFLYKKGINAIRYTKFFTMLLFSYLSVINISFLFGKNYEFNILIFSLIIALMLFVLIYFLCKMNKKQ